MEHKFESAKISSSSKELPKRYKFTERLDADGVREILNIGNERRGGCSFRCVACGVRSEARLTLKLP